MVAPPCCAVCGRDGTLGGVLRPVEYADYDPSWRSPEWDDCGLSHNSIGVHGPEGLGRFCFSDFERAKQLRRLTVAEAVARLKDEFELGDASCRVGSQFGPFHLLRVLGRGRLAQVFEAEHTVERSNVALKVISPLYSQDRSFRLRLQRNIPPSARVSEPHIVPIYDWGEIDERPYVVMPVIDGINLDRQLATARQLSAAQTVAVLSQIALAIDALHAQGLIHQNVRPDNILVGRDLAFLLSGAEYLITDGEANPHPMKYAYSAPERFTGDATTFSSDIYALTCVLYECLTGRPPYPGDSTEAVIAGHLQRPAPRPSSQLHPRVPARLDDVVARGLAKDPRERYPSAGALALAARQALATPGRMPSPPGRGGTRLSGFRNTHVLQHKTSMGMGVDAGGSFLIVGSHPARVWDIPTGRCVLTIDDFRADTVNWSFTDDGASLLTAGSGRTVRVWDPVSGRLVRLLRGHWRQVRTIAVSADGRIAATGSDDGRVRIWDLATGRRVETIRVDTGPVFAVALNRDGTVVLCGCRAKASGWDVATGRCLHTLSGLGGIAWVVQLSDDGRTALALADETTHVWDVATGATHHSFRGHTDSWQAVALARRGDIAVAGSSYGQTNVWDVASGHLLHSLSGHRGKVTSVAVSADSRIVLSGSVDSDALLWDLETGCTTARLDTHTGPVDSVALSADARIAATCAQDGAVRIWELRWQ